MTDERINVDADNLSFHIRKDGEYEVWFNWGDDFSGFIIGLGKTRDESVADAVKTLETAINKLQEPSL